MPEYVRALDQDTGAEVSVFRSELDHGNYRELDAPALNANGDPLPPVQRPLKSLSSNADGHKATDNKES